MSRLTQIIGLFYHLQTEDVAALESQLLEARKRAWVTALRAEARAHGCGSTPNAPRGDDLAELKAMSREDAKSIADTFNRDAERQAEKLYAANRRGNRYYYAKRMEQWVSERNVWKAPQIALTTDTATAELARRRFRAMNYDGAQKFLFTGPPPTCERCTRLFAAGQVDAVYIRRHPTPVHIGCPHSWTPVRRPQIDCAELWIG